MSLFLSFAMILGHTLMPHSHLEGLTYEEFANHEDDHDHHDSKDDLLDNIFSYFQHQINTQVVYLSNESKTIVKADRVNHANFIQYFSNSRLVSMPQSINFHPPENFRIPDDSNFSSQSFRGPPTSQNYS